MNVHPNLAIVLAVLMSAYMIWFSGNMRSFFSRVFVKIASFFMLAIGSLVFAAKYLVIHENGKKEIEYDSMLIMVTLVLYLIFLIVIDTIRHKISLKKET